MNYSAFLSRLLARPARSLGLILLATLALAPLVMRLRLDTDVIALFPQEDREARAFARYTKSVLSAPTLTLLVETQDPGALLPFVERLSEALTKLPEAGEVRYKLSAASGAFLRDHLLSLLDESDLEALAKAAEPEALDRRVRKMRGLLAAPGGSALAPILTADPLDLLPRLFARLSTGMPVDTQSGYFRSADGKAAVIHLRPKNVDACRPLLSAAESAATTAGAKLTDSPFGSAPIEVGMTGSCAHSLNYRDWLHRDTTLSTLLSGLAVLLLFGLSFRALRVLPLVGIPLVVGLVWTAAFAALVFGRVNAVSLAFGTLLFAIGIDVPIQIYNRLREGDADVKSVFAEMASPSLSATLGPAAVFFCCALSQFRGLGELGVLAGAGLLFNYLAMMTLLPVLLAAVPRAWWLSSASSGAPRIAAFVGNLARTRPWALLGVAAVLGALFVPPLLRLHLDERLIAIQPQSLPPVKVDVELQKHFGDQSRIVFVLSEAPAIQGALERADAWLKYAEQLRAKGAIAGYQSASSFFPSEKTQKERRNALERLGPKEIAARLKDSLERNGFDAEPFRPFLGQLESQPPLIDLAAIRRAQLDFLLDTHFAEDSDGTRIVTFLFLPDNKEDAGLAAIRAIQTPDSLTGPRMLEQTLRRILAQDTRRVTIASVLAVALLLLAYYRNLRIWLAVMLPLSLAWIFFGGLLQLCGLPLNLFNLLCIPLVVGYGIDDHVFLLHRQLETRDIVATLTRTGRAVILTSLATMAGFGGLAVARFDGLRILGLSGALAVAACLFAALFVLPALLTLLFPPQRS